MLEKKARTHTAPYNASRIDHRLQREQIYDLPKSSEYDRNGRYIGSDPDKVCQQYKLDKKQRDRQSFTGSSAWQHTIPELNEKAYHPECYEDYQTAVLRKKALRNDVFGPCLPTLSSSDDDTFDSSQSNYVPPHPTSPIDDPLAPTNEHLLQKIEELEFNLECCIKREERETERYKTRCELSEEKATHLEQENCDLENELREIKYMVLKYQSVEQKLQTVQHENGILKREKDQLGIDIEEWKTIHRKQQSDLATVNVQNEMVKRATDEAKKTQDKWKETLEKSYLILSTEKTKICHERDDLQHQLKHKHDALQRLESEKNQLKNQRDQANIQIETFRKSKDASHQDQIIRQRELYQEARNMRKERDQLQKCLNEEHEHKRHHERLEKENIRLQLNIEELQTELKNSQQTINDVLCQENKEGLMKSDETRRLKSERDEAINDVEEYKKKNNELLKQYQNHLESLEKQNEELRSNCDAMTKDKLANDAKNEEQTSQMVQQRKLHDESKQFEKERDQLLMQLKEEKEHKHHHEALQAENIQLKEEINKLKHSLENSEHTLNGVLCQQNVQGQMSSVENTRLKSERDAARAQMVEYTRKNEELLKHQMAQQRKLHDESKQFEKERDQLLMQLKEEKEHKHHHEALQAENIQLKEEINKLKHSLENSEHTLNGVLYQQNVQGQMSSVENTRLISERDAARAQMVEYTRKNEELLKQNERRTTDGEMVQVLTRQVDTLNSQLSSIKQELDVANHRLERKNNFTQEENDKVHSLTQMLAQRDAKIEELNKLLGGKLSKDMSRDEANFENINRKWRPSTIREEYSQISFQNASIIKSMILKPVGSMISDEEWTRCVGLFFSSIYMIAGEEMRNKYTNDMKDISKILRRPLGGRGGVNAGQSSHSEQGDDQKVLDEAADYLRDNSGNVNTEPITDMVLQKVLDGMKTIRGGGEICKHAHTFCSHITQGTHDRWYGEIQRFVQDICKLAWQMTVQRPAMTFTTPGIGEAVKEKYQKALPKRGITDSSYHTFVVDYYLEPALCQNDNVLEQGRVVLCVKP